MPRHGDSEKLVVLRDAIARIEGGASCRASMSSAGMGRTSRVAKIPLGPAGAQLPLDRVLGGGLARGGLSEVVAVQAGDAAAASGFALALAARFSTGGQRPVVWILEDGARAETGMPYAPGLAAHGLDPARLVVVRAGSGAEGLWAMEEALRCSGVAAVVLDLWRCRLYDLVASRRLVLAAKASGTPGILVAAGAPGAELASAAAVRFAVAAAPGPHLAVHSRASPDAARAPTRLPLPGRAAWSVRLARIRAGPAGGAAAFDRDTVWPLVWDHEEAWFCDAYPVSSPAVSGNRPSRAARRYA